MRDISLGIVESSHHPNSRDTQQPSVFGDSRDFEDTLIDAPRYSCAEFAAESEEIEALRERVAALQEDCSIDFPESSRRPSNHSTMPPSVSGAGAYDDLLVDIPRPRIVASRAELNTLLEELDAQHEPCEARMRARMEMSESERRRIRDLRNTKLQGTMEMDSNERRVRNNEHRIECERREADKNARREEYFAAKNERYHSEQRAAHEARLQAIMGRDDHEHRREALIEPRSKQLDEEDVAQGARNARSDIEREMQDIKFERMIQGFEREMSKRAERTERAERQYEGKGKGKAVEK
jgi:hypothetical protein